MTVFFFDDNQKLIKSVGTDKLIVCFQEKELSGNKEDLVKNTLKVTTIFDSELEQASFMAVEESEEETFSLYRILQTDDPDNKLVFVGSDFALNELDGYIVKEVRPNKELIGSVARRLLEGTEWQIRHVDSGLNTVSGSFYYTSVKESLKSLQTFGCEIEFRCSLNSDGVHEKWINIYKKIGKDSQKRFTYGDKALSIVRTIDRQNIFTSIIGRGKGEEVGETKQGDATYGRRIEFGDVVWSKANGDPLNKPKGQIFLENPSLTNLYGIPLENGKMRKRETVVIFEDEADPKEVLKKTYEQLQILSRPLMQFKTKVLTGDVLGNTVTIHHHEKGYHYETRVFKTSLDRLTNRLECELGDNIVQSSSKQAANQINSIQKLDEKKTSYYDSNKIAMYQTDMIRGAGKTGGSIFQMSPSDTGDGDSRVPFQTVYMNGPSIDKSNNFLVLNSQGLGFLKGDFWNAKYENAWTIDGVLNASFIKAGKLNGVQIQAEDEDFLIDMFNGRILFRDNIKDIDLGTIQATRDGGTGAINGFAITQRPNQIFSINSHDGKGQSTPIVQVPADSTKDKRKLNLFGDVKLEGNFWVNGVKIDTNGGGSGGGNGGWNGTYPPEVITQPDKFAWEAWATLISLGYSKEAAAAILGNIQGEAGPSMNPDVDQVGGPAYGAIQFDGSSYPLIGEPTNDGREYFQRLHNASGVGGDYTQMSTQMRVVDWTMYNGQWIGAVAPTSVSGFKNVGSPEIGAYAFEKNFERPAADHPERQGWAREWFEKFKDLKQPGGKYGMPVPPGYTITSWYGDRDDPTNPGNLETHKGMDFADSLGTPIFAATDGVVNISLPTASSGGFGEYIKIKGSDGLQTGYGHMTTRMVSVGANVTKGQQIGTMGSTGNSTGSHLHFSVSTGDWDGYMDPAPYLGLTRP